MSKNNLKMTITIERGGVGRGGAKQQTQFSKETEKKERVDTGEEASL